MYRVGSKERITEQKKEGRRAKNVEVKTSRRYNLAGRSARKQAGDAVPPSCSSLTALKLELMRN